MAITFKSAAAAVVACCSLAVSLSAAAQTFPNRPVRVIYSFTAGGGPDVLARKVTTEASKALGQPIIYENRTGANGRMGIQPMKDAPADGHFLNIVNDGVAVSQPAQDPDFRFEPGKDYAPVIILFESPQVLLARPDMPFKDMKGMIAYAKANPGKLNFASTAGAAGQFVFLRMVRDLGIDITEVAMKGGADAGTVTLGGHTDMFISTSTMKQQVDAGKLLVLAASSKERWKLFAQAPTFREIGMSFEYTVKFVMMTTAGTPRDTVARLHRLFTDTVYAPEMVKQIEEVGYSAGPRMSPDEVGAFVQSEIKVWTPILRKLGSKG